MYYVYILTSIKYGKYYTGYTKDLNRRLVEHNNNNTLSLRNRGPYKIIYFEEFATLKAAKKRELKIKSYKGGHAFKKLLGTKC